MTVTEMSVSRSRSEQKRKTQHMVGRSLQEQELFNAESKSEHIRKKLLSSHLSKSERAQLEEELVHTDYAINALLVTMRFECKDAADSKCIQMSKYCELQTRWFGGKTCKSKKQTPEKQLQNDIKVVIQELIARENRLKQLQAHSDALTPEEEAEKTALSTSQRYTNIALNKYRRLAQDENVLREKLQQYEAEKKQCEHDIRAYQRNPNKNPSLCNTLRLTALEKSVHKAREELAKSSESTSSWLSKHRDKIGAGVAFLAVIITIVYSSAYLKEKILGPNNELIKDSIAWLNALDLKGILERMSALTKEGIKFTEILGLIGTVGICAWGGLGLGCIAAGAAASAYKFFGGASAAA